MRRHPRYFIHGEDGISGHLGDFRGTLQILSLSEGGASFVSTEVDPDFTPPRKVGCRVHWDLTTTSDQMAVWEAELLYVRPKGAQLFEYGLRFSKQILGNPAPLFNHLQQKPV